MTADVVPLPERKPPLVLVANDDDHRLRPPDPREVAIERCVDRIARAMGRLTLEQRIGLEHALDALVFEIEWHNPWD